MKNLMFIAFALVLGMFFTVAEAPAQIDLKIDPNLPIKLVVNQQDLTKYADKLEAKLKNKSVGYSFAVITNNNLMVSRAGGDARRPPDINARQMSADDKFNIASISKTITAAAVWKLMNEKKITLDTMIHPYLPSKWKLGPRFNTITFGELLTHRSGIRCDEVTYANLRKCVASGVVLADKRIQKYENGNFSIFRFIIPRLNGFDDSQFADNSAGDALASAMYAQLYAQYVQKNIFEPIGLIGIEQKPIANNPALAYQYPLPDDIKGDDFGDMTETGASRGWNMSAKQLAIFMNGLLNTTKIMPRRLSAKMETAQLGLWKVEIDGKLVNQQHGGGYPGKDEFGKLWNKGEMNTIAMAFPNGMSVAIFINSQRAPGLNSGDAAREAMKEVWK